VLIGQLGITISGPLKATVFLMFLFAVGYGVGPQFVCGIAKDGVRRRRSSPRSSASGRERSSGSVPSRPRR